MKTSFVSNASRPSPLRIPIGRLFQKSVTGQKQNAAVEFGTGQVNQFGILDTDDDEMADAFPTARTNRFTKVQSHAPPAQYI
jgi:hypothetical protein